MNLLESFECEAFIVSHPNSKQKHLCALKSGNVFLEPELAWMKKDSAFLCAGYDNIEILKINDSVLFPIDWVINEFEINHGHKYPNRLESIKRLKTQILNRFQ